MSDAEEFILSIVRPMLGDPKQYGSVAISIQAGEVVHIDQGISHKPPVKVKAGARRIVR